MKGKDFVRREVQNTSPDILKGQPQYNAAQETPFFLGKINADRTKITDTTTGKEYNLHFTGNPREYEYAAATSPSDAVVNAQQGKFINIDGDNSKALIIVQRLKADFSENYGFAIFDTKTSLSYYVPFNELLPELVRPDEFMQSLSPTDANYTFCMFSPSGKHLIFGYVDNPSGFSGRQFPISLKWVILTSVTYSSETMTNNTEVLRTLSYASVTLGSQNIEDGFFFTDTFYDPGFPSPPPGTNITTLAQVAIKNNNIISSLQSNAGITNLPFTIGAVETSNSATLALSGEYTVDRRVGAQVDLNYFTAVCGTSPPFLNQCLTSPVHQTLSSVSQVFSIVLFRVADASNFQAGSYGVLGETTSLSFPQVTDSTVQCPTLPLAIPPAEQTFYTCPTQIVTQGGFTQFSGILTQEQAAANVYFSSFVSSNGQNWSHLQSNVRNLKGVFPFPPFSVIYINNEFQPTDLGTGGFVGNDSQGFADTSNIYFNSTAFFSHLAKLDSYLYASQLGENLIGLKLDSENLTTNTAKLKLEKLTPVDGTGLNFPINNTNEFLGDSTLQVRKSVTSKTLKFIPGALNNTLGKIPTFYSPQSTQVVYSPPVLYCADSTPNVFQVK